MHTKDLPLYNCTKRKQVEKFIQHPPSLDTYFSLAFLVKTKETVHTGNLVISPKEEDVLWKLYLVSKEKDDAFQGHRASVYVVAQEEIASVSGSA